MKVRTFDFDSHKITTLTDKENQIWFVAYEVCKKLGYTNTSDIIKKHCRKKGILNGYTLTDGGKQKSILIDEPNLYRLVMRSKMPDAEKFQDWVYEEVLPSIRKTGKYEVTQSFKKLSTEKRNELTAMWKEHGCTEPYHYSNLTKEEYKLLFNDSKKKKAEMSREELLTLSALESMEALALFHGNQNGYYECRDSLKQTAEQIPAVTKKAITA